LTIENWLSKAKDFEELWNFNHCIGAIDGKHIVIQVNYILKYKKIIIPQILSLIYNNQYVSVSG